MRPRKMSEIDAHRLINSAAAATFNGHVIGGQNYGAKKWKFQGATSQPNWIQREKKLFRKLTRLWLAEAKNDWEFSHQADFYAWFNLQDFSKF